MPIDDVPTPTPEFYRLDEHGRKLAVVYRYRMQWESLQQTENHQVRYCTNCSQPVFLVADAENCRRAVAAGRCVMVEQIDRPFLFGAPAVMPAGPDALKWDD